MSGVRSQRETISVRMILIVGSLAAFGPLTIDMYLPGFPEIGHDLDASASSVQLSLTATLIGLALGQLLIGPMSDRFGRRRPLFAGLVLFTVSSALCALSPTIEVLVVLRLAQGLGGSAGIVIAIAVVRDLYSGVTAARFFSVLMLVSGLGPILAPSIGAGLLHTGTWRAIFAALTVLGLVLLAVAVRLLPETLPSGRRNSGGVGHAIGAMRSVITDRLFLVNALAGGFVSAAIFAYIAGSSFVFQNVYGLSPQLFSLLFGLNACGLIATSQVNGRIVHRYGCSPLLTVGIMGLGLSSVMLLGLVLTDLDTAASVLVCVFVAMSSMGFVVPNSSALAMNNFPHAAGSASSLLGSIRFVMGAVSAPIVGIRGDHDPLPMAVIMAFFALAAVAVRLLFRLKPSDMDGRSLQRSVPAEAAAETPI